MFKFMMFFLVFSFVMNFWNYMYLIIIIMLMFNLYYPFFSYSFFNNFFFIDKVNFWLLLLTLWIIMLMILSMMKIKIMNNNYKMMLFMVMLLCLFLFLSFSVNNYIMFYIFFEMSLIPTLYMILGWGYQPERILAGLYLLFYTLVASLPLLLGIFFMFNNLKLYQFFNYNIYCFNYLLFLSLTFAFLVKMPMFFVHLWLPKAHVEAPISGSMILAAILLKLGGYGLLRVMGLLMMFKLINMLILLISIFGGMLISFNCLRQLDLKLLIAYSSVAHMGLTLGGLFTITYWGVNGCYFMMIAHGLCSSGLFCLANISYERSMSRSMLVNKGMMNFLPSMAIWWFFMCINNMSSPISLNLIAEVSLINSIISYSFFNFFLIFLLCFFSASYCYYLYSYSQHGLFYSSIYSFSNSSIREMLLMYLHWLPLNCMFLKILLI